MAHSHPVKWSLANFFLKWPDLQQIPLSPLWPPTNMLQIKQLNKHSSAALGQDFQALPQGGRFPQGANKRRPVPQGLF